ncbi:MAG: signal peptidase I [Gammaproteobacteria bacterium]|nr:signal peptidase I [Gammaproteobacteria bacterium]
MDFATIMVIAILVTGVIWLIDIKQWKPKREAEVAKLKRAGAAEDAIENAGKEPILVEYSRSFFPIILAVLVLRSFLVEPFRIPSGSMMPTLVVGDFILVNKFTYGLKLPVINTKFLDMGKPQRGDIVVFRFPKDPSIDYIKRVIGLPGDKIRYQGKTIFVNGKEVPATSKGQYTSLNTGMVIPGLEQREEVLGDVVHDILVQHGAPSKSGELIVPDGHYFVMGDNRDNSNDSRFWGTVPEENLVGRAFFIWMNLDFDDFDMKWDRIGTSLK